MKHLFEVFSAPAWTNLVIALLHSLWLGVIWAALLCMGLRLSSAPRRRYIVGLSAIAGLLLSVFATMALRSEALSATVRIGIVEQASVVAAPSNSALNSGGEANAHPVATAPKTNSVNWTAVAAAGWLSGICIMLARLVSALVGTARIRSEGHSVSDSIVLNVLAEVRQSLGMDRLISIAESSRVYAPCVCGLIAPVILFPASMLTATPPEQIRAILAHELAHIRRHDFLIDIFQQVIEALLFFNPAVWWINRQIRLEREACCDEIAAELISSPEDYVRTLSDFAERSNSHAEVLQPAFPGDRNPSSLLERNRRLLLPGYRPLVRLPWHSLVGVLMLSALLLSVIWQGSYLAVAVAAEILSPEQRIEKIAQMTAAQGLEKRAYGPDDNVRISGRVRTEDGRVLKEGVQVHAHSESRRQSYGYGGLKMTDGYFDDTLPYGIISLAVFAHEGYGPAFLNGLVPKPGSGLTNLDIVLPKGFTATVRVVDTHKRPVPDARIEGTYNHRAGSIPIRLVTDGRGEATLANCVDTPLTFRTYASGYQSAVREDVRLSAKEPLIWTLEPSRSTTGKVIARTTRKPVENATLKLLYRGPHMSINYGSAESAPLLTRTDQTGEFQLDSLADGTKHGIVIEAQGFAPQLAKNIMAGQAGITVELGPEITIDGEIRGDLSRLQRFPDPVIDVANVIHLNEQYRHKTPRHIPVRIEGGVGRFTATGLMEGEVELNAGGTATTLNVKESIKGLVIELEPPTTNSPPSPTRTVVIQLQTPAGAPPVRGVLTVQSWAQSDGVSTNSYVEVTNCQARVEARYPGWVSWDTEGLIGYWIPPQHALRVDAGPAPLLVETKASPAGAIQGKVLGVDGGEVGGVLVSVVEAKRAPSKELSGNLGEIGKNSASPDDGPTRFVVQPLPLGGEYLLIARRGQQVCASEIIALNEENPIHDITLRFADGERLTGTVTDQTGASLTAIRVKLDYVTPYSHTFAAASDGITDDHGNFVFENVNSRLPGKFEILVDDQPGFQPKRQPITTLKWPVVVRLEAGFRVSGVVVHAHSGNPLAGAEVYALPAKIDPTGKDSQFVDADARTDSEGRFTFSRLSRREYILHCRSGPITHPTAANGVGGIRCTAGKDAQVVIRITPHQGVRLIEAKPVATN